MIKKIVFKMLAKVNRILLPRYSKRDLNRLTKLDKVIVAYRYWVTKNALE